MKLKKLFAFTLAEVLITLSILGVVAAITVPSLIKRQHKKEVETKLTKFYSTMTDAINLAIAENGPIDKWAEDGGEPADKIKKYLAITKEIPVEERPDRYNPKGQLTQEQGGRGTQLKDGSTMSIRWINPCDAQYGCAEIIVDVNGSKEPNADGKDIFPFMLYRYGNQGDVILGAYPVYSSEDTPAKRTSQKNLCYNDPNWGMLGRWCTGVFLGNKFKFPSDYPWL